MSLISVCVFTRAGMTSLAGVEEEYRWAFLAANFSVGMDFPANLNLRLSTFLWKPVKSLKPVLAQGVVKTVGSGKGRCNDGAYSTAIKLTRTVYIL